MKTKLIISGLAFLAITALANGQNMGVNSPSQNSTGKGRAYVDANNNGTCDNYENRATNNSSCRRYANFNYCGQGQGQGQRHGKGQKAWSQGQGRGKNFVDADKNGICDHNDTPAKK